MPVGSGQRPLCGALNNRLSPSSNAGSLPSNNPDGVVGALPSVLGIPYAASNPPPTASTLQPREAGGGRRQVLSPPQGEPAPVAGTRGSRARAPRLLRLRPLLRLRGRRSLRKLRRVSPRFRNLAPRPARSRSRVGASYATRGRLELREAAGRGAVGATLHSAGAGVCRARGQQPLLVYGTASSDASLPHSQTEIAPPGRGRQRLPPARSLKKTSAHSQDGPGPRPLGLDPPGPRPAGGPPALRPRRPRFCSPGPPPARRQVPASPAATLAGALIPSAPGQSSCQGGGALAYLAYLACSPDVRGVVPLMRAV